MPTFSRLLHLLLKHSLVHMSWNDACGHMAAVDAMVHGVTFEYYARGPGYQPKGIFKIGPPIIHPAMYFPSF